MLSTDTKRGQCLGAAPVLAGTPSTTTTPYSTSSTSPLQRETNHWPFDPAAAATLIAGLPVVIRGTHGSPAR